MQSVIRHTVLVLLPGVGNTQAFVTLYELALNLAINSSISFPAICSHKLPRLFHSSGKKKRNVISLKSVENDTLIPLK